MSYEINTSDPNSSRPAQAILRAIDAKLGDGADAWSLITRLMTEAGREDLVHELAATAAAAGKSNPVRTMGWMGGGPAPFGDDNADIDGPPGPLKHPRQRKEQSVGRMMSEARAGRSDVDRQIAKKEAELSELKVKRDRLDALGATAAIFGLFDAMKKELKVPLAFGPAYTVMRAVCGWIIEDPDIYIPSDVPDRLRDRQAFTAIEASRVQNVLADMVGDEAFELDLYRAIKAVTYKHKDRAAGLTKQQKATRLERAKVVAPTVVGSFGKRISEHDCVFVEVEMVLWRELPTPLELTDRNGLPTYDDELLMRIAGRTRAANILLEHGIGTITGAMIGATIECERKLRAKAAMLLDLGSPASHVERDVRPFWLEELAARRSQEAYPKPNELPPFTGHELDPPQSHRQADDDIPFAIP